MHEIDAVNALSALANEHRLRVFRMLIKAGPAGLTPGTIAARLELPASSLSFHLTQLQQAGLIAATRDRRNIIYTTDIDTTRELLSFLSEDCCGGRPELCAGLPVTTVHADPEKKKALS
jgi:DNA-binding transcriptional ArsR family regulator